MKKLKWKGIILSFLLLIGVAIGITIIPNVFADSKTIEVEPGAGTLKKAVQAASDGDILLLKAGSYTSDDIQNKTIEIDKSLTIKGAGNKTIVDVPFKITKESSKVNLNNYASSMIQVEPNFIYIQVDSNAEVNIDNVIIRGILRADGNTKKYPIHDAKVLDITKNANNAKINVSNSELAKPGIHYGVDINANNVILTIDNTMVIGRTAINLKDGKNNQLNIKNQSEISGPSISYTDKESIIIDNQDTLNINIDNSIVYGSIPSNDGPIKMFSFKNGSKNVTIDIKNGSKIADKLEQDSKSRSNIIFAFGLLLIVSINSFGVLT